MHPKPRAIRRVAPHTPTGMYRFPSVRTDSGLSLPARARAARFSLDCNDTSHVHIFQSRSAPPTEPITPNQRGAIGRRRMPRRAHVRYPLM